MILSDVQDATDSVEQAGLYVLYDHLDDLCRGIPQAGVSPLEVRRNPAVFRGKVLFFKVLIHPEISELPLTRDRLASETNLTGYYVTGQIPFGEKQRMPAIILLRTKPKLKDTVDLWGVRGYFYMVLRTPTRKSAGQSGPNVLDYLVFVADHLDPESGPAYPSGVIRMGQKWIGLLVGLCAAAAWFWLRRRARTPVLFKRTISLQNREKTVLHYKRDFKGSVVTVALGARSYPIYIGAGILDEFGEMFQFHCKQRRTAVITDETVGGLYGEQLMKSLAGEGRERCILSVSPGESSKRMEICERLYDELFDFSLERSDRVIALGGGVVGDLAGFVAATFKRGVPFVQIPTTLLAMVDSSIGGKTGINHPRGKNMIGAFHQPEFVYIDTAVLRTLPRRELGCGLAETVKHGVIRDGEFFQWLEHRAEDILELKPDCLIELVERNCRIKAEVVSADERESGLRGILNLGHTIGHTFETVLPERGYHHGEAVSLGMMAACYLAVERKLLSDEDSDRIEQLLDRFGLPTRIEHELPVEKLLAAMRQDKKVKQGKIRFVLPTRIGDCTFVEDLSEEQIQEAILALTN